MTELFRLPGRGTTFDGSPLTPGVNVDRVNIIAGQEMASNFGYSDEESQWVVWYALWRHRRGEEGGAERSALSGGIDLTSWKAILAAALAHASE